MFREIKELDQLGVFAKYWQAGNVKTRLAASLGAAAAAELYHCFLTAVIENCERAFDGRLVLAYTPPERLGAFSDLAGERWHLEPQAAGDLRLWATQISKDERFFKKVVG